MGPQLIGGQHSYSTNTSQAGYANEQSIYSYMSMGHPPFTFVSNNGFFTLAKFVSKTVIKSDMWQSCKSHMTVTTVLALAAWAAQQQISVAPPKVAKASASVLLLLALLH